MRPRFLLYALRHQLCAPGQPAGVTELSDREKTLRAGSFRPTPPSPLRGGGSVVIGHVSRLSHQRYWLAHLFTTGATRQPAMSLPTGSCGPDRLMAGAGSTVSRHAPCVLAESPGAMYVIGDLVLCGERNQRYLKAFDEKAMPCRRKTLFVLVRAVTR
jgi:hypothetical protein